MIDRKVFGDFALNMATFCFSVTLDNIDDLDLGICEVVVMGACDAGVF